MKLLARLLVLLPFIIFTAVCDDGPDDPCPTGLMLCADSVCEECCLDENCIGRPGMVSCQLDYIICNDEHKCECACYEEDEDCSRGADGCCTGMACDVFTNTCMEECNSDAECTAPLSISHDVAVFRSHAMQQQFRIALAWSNTLTRVLYQTAANRIVPAMALASTIIAGRCPVNR